MAAEHNLAEAMLAHVREEARRHGLANLRPGSLVRGFAGRAAKSELLAMADRVVRDVRQETSRFGADAPATTDPGRMIDCKPQRMRLSVAGCARLWQSCLHKRPAPYEGRASCVACRVGAANAGIHISAVAGLTEQLRTICARCRRPASRLINGDYCISCYNRHSEAMKGKNARGTRPRICDALGIYQVTAQTGAAPALAVSKPAMDAAEVIIGMARRAEQPMAFGWGLAGPGDIVDVAA